MSDKLPPGWKKKRTADGRVYYEDDNTKTTHWKLPEDLNLPSVPTPQDDDPQTPTEVLPPGWKKKRTADGRVYYEDDNTKTTHWKLPEVSNPPAAPTQGTIAPGGVSTLAAPIQGTTAPASVNILAAPTQGTTSPAGVNTPVVASNAKRGHMMKQDSSFSTQSKKLVRHDTTSLYVLQGAKPLVIEDGQNLFKLFEANENGEVTHTEIKRACGGGNPEVVKYIEKYSDTPLGLLSDETELAKLLVEIDLNHDELICYSEWKEFLIFLIKTDLDYLHQKGLAGMRAYWGKGVDEDPTDCLSCVDNGCIDRGWLDDFWYYQCNNNFLFAIFLSDKRHPLKKHSRLNIEFVCQSYVFMIAAVLASMAAEYKNNLDDDHEPKGMEPGGESWMLLMMFLMGTIECVTIRKFLQFVYQCPCCILRNNKTSVRQWLQGCGGVCGSSFGFLFFLMGCVFLIIGITIGVGNGAGFLINWLISWAQSYALQMFTDSILVFNPFPLFYYLRKSCCCCCLGTVGVAQWQAERAKVAEYESVSKVQNKDAEIELRAAENV